MPVSCTDSMICSIADMLVMTETLGALSLWLVRQQLAKLAKVGKRAQCQQPLAHSSKAKHATW